MAVYKIKDVEVLTGIKAHTIRIWEKRYGILEPSRTETQIRTYSDAQIASLLNISLLNNNGHKISKIAGLSEAEINKLVWDIRIGKKNCDSGKKLILALIELDEKLFRDTLNNLINELGLALTFSAHIIPFLDRIGVMWLTGSISPAQEHFISNLIRQKIISEIDKQIVPETTDAPIMLYLPEHEWHEISLLFYHYLLRSKGLHTVYLGQSLPYDSLVDCIKTIKPKAILSAWLTAVDLSFLKNYFRKLKEDTDGIPIFAGGIQINLNGKELADNLTEITNSGTLLQQILPTLKLNKFN
jgi:DNA-binding transcriptional MerR regulator